MLPTISSSHHASLSDLVANDSTMSKKPLNRKYQPTKAAIQTNDWAGRARMMIPATAKITASPKCSQRQLGLVIAYRTSDSAATRTTMPASAETAATET